VVGDDGGRELGGVAAGVAASHVHTGGELGVFVLAFPDCLQTRQTYDETKAWNSPIRAQEPNAA